MTLSAKQIERELKKLGDEADAVHLSRFFKTGKGEYGEGDRFLGIRVPVIRQQVKKYRETALDNVLTLLHSPFHEIRLFALLVLVDQFSRGSAADQKRIYQHYLDNTAYINNWDLVDLSAHKIIGPFLADKDRKILYKLARSEDLWERRISILATFHLIGQHDFHDALEIAAILRDDREDLIHKAVGWMLREVGKRDIDAEKAFLQKHYRKMPRTMLRYAIEKFPEKERKAWLKGEM